MIHIIITSYNEPNSTRIAINKFLNQNIKEKYKIIVADPFPEIEEMILNEFKGKVEYFADPDEGKSYCLNILFNKLYSDNKNDIIIMSDGDVFVDENAVNEILKKFEDPNVGVVTGRPVSLNKRNDKYGYWSHFLLDVGAHEISRKKRYAKQEFLECNGYLFAIRNGVIREIPLNVAEDTIIPYLFWKKGYKIAYAEKSLVYVKWPDNLKDWLKQKKRAANSHNNLKKYYPDFPRVKSFFNEMLEGVSFKVLSYPKNVRELYWTFLLYPVRLYMWLSLFYDNKFHKKGYKDGWRDELAVESTRLE
jgi:poly-beta-1,6-N-acetyl-D-glucosamine synthase